MKKLNLICRDIFRLETIDLLAQRLVDRCFKSDPLVVYLKGDLGAGKTTLTSAVLRAAGLPKEIPVLSPTFPYIQVYEIGGNKIAHLDLYRLDHVDAETLPTLVDDPSSFRALFIEWPERLTDINLLPPTFVWTLKSLSEDERLFQLEE